MTKKKGNGSNNPPPPSTGLVRQKKSLQALLEQSRSRIEDVLPAHLKPERMLRLALLAASKTPRLYECDPITVVAAVVDASRLALEIGRHAHLVPFWNGQRKVFECVMIPDYRGFADLAWRSAQVLIEARLVYEGDEWNYEEGTSPKIVHRPRPDAKRDADHVVAAYMIARFPDGRVKPEWMWRDELDAIWKRSKAKDSGPWQTDRGEMYKKTVVKRGAKLLPQSPELAEAIELDNRAESGEIGVPLPERDTESGLAAAAAERTAERTAELKRELEGQPQQEPPPPVNAPDGDAPPAPEQPSLADEDEGLPF